MLLFNSYQLFQFSNPPLTHACFQISKDLFSFSSSQRMLKSESHFYAFSSPSPSQSHICFVPIFHFRPNLFFFLLFSRFTFFLKQICDTKVTIYAIPSPRARRRKSPWTPPCCDPSVTYGSYLGLFFNLFRAQVEPSQSSTRLDSTSRFQWAQARAKLSA